MFNEFVPLISEEQFGAFLEGKLSESENVRIRNLISHDDMLKEIMEANNAVDESIKQIETSAFEFADEIIDIDSFQLPVVEFAEISYADSFDLFDIDTEQNEESHSNAGGEYYSFDMEENIDTFNPDNTF